MGRRWCGRCGSVDVWNARKWWWGEIVVRLQRGLHEGIEDWGIKTDLLRY